MDMTGEHLIPAPRDTVWRALNDPELLKRAIPGCEEVVKLSDTEFAAKVTLPTDGSQEFSFFAQDERGIAPSANLLRVSDLPNVLEAEPNNVAAEATPAANAPTALNGIIQQDGDMDFFKFTTTRAGKSSPTTTAAACRTRTCALPFPMTAIISSRSGTT